MIRSSIKLFKKESDVLIISISLFNLHLSFNPLQIVVRIRTETIELTYET